MSPEVPIIILIVIIPTFLILRWISLRFFKKKKTSSWTSIVGTIIIAPILYFKLVFTVSGYLFYEPQYDFNREKWFADKHSRFEMRDDIVISGILNGKSKSEVIELIGKPEPNNSTELWKYNLGMCRFRFEWQLNYLELTFKKGEVYRVETIEIIE